MEQQAPVIHSDPEILGGTPVFVGTRVPLRNLIDYLEHGHGLDEFLDEFPSVTREQAIAALEALSTTPVSTRDLLGSLAERIPADCSLSDLRYHLDVLESAQQGIADAVAGRTTSHEQVASTLRQRHYETRS